MATSALIHIPSCLKSELFSDAASSLIVAIGIIFNLLGYHSFDLIAAIIVGVMILKMGWTFSHEAIHALTDKAADTDEVEKIKKIILETPGVVNVHDLRTRKVGDSIIADVHIEVKGTLTVAEGHGLRQWRLSRRCATLCRRVCRTF